MKKLWLYCICLLLTAPTLAAVKQVQGGADLRRAIRSLGGNDTLVVAAGNYTIDEIVIVGNNTVIMGEEGARPSIELETFRIGTEASRLVFRNLDLKLRSRFLVGMLSQLQTPDGRPVDVTLTAEIGDAARHDDVEQTINYVAVYQLVEREMKKPSHIIEHVALRILDALFATFPALLHAEITVGKLAPPAGGKMRRVAVTLAR